MSIQQLRGTTALREATTPLVAQIIYDTDLEKLFVGDGSTSGGLEVGLTEEVDSALRLHGAVYNDTGAALVVGAPVYMSGFNLLNNLPEVSLADASASATMPAVGLIEEEIADASSGYAVISGKMSGLDTSSYSAGDPLYISETTGELTSTKPTGSALIQKVGLCLRSHVSLGAVGVSGAGRTNDVPNMAENNVWCGNASGVAVATDSPILASLETTGSIDIGGNVGVDGYITINQDISGGDVYLYFQTSAGVRFLMWDESDSVFYFNNKLKAASTIEALGDLSTLTNLIVGGDSRLTGDLYLNYPGSDGDSFIYFYDGASSTGQSIMWDDSEDEFVFSANALFPSIETGTLAASSTITAVGGISTDGNIDLNANSSSGDVSITFGTSAGNRTLIWDESESRFYFNATMGTAGNFYASGHIETAASLTVATTTSITGDTDIGGNIELDGNLYLNYSGPDGDSFIYFYDGTATGQSISWDDSVSRFAITVGIATTAIDATGSIKADLFMQVNANGTSTYSVIYFDTASSGELTFYQAVDLFYFNRPLSELVDRAKPLTSSTTDLTLYPGARTTTGTPYRIYRLTMTENSTYTISTDGAYEGDSCVIALNPATFTESWSGIDWGDDGAPTLTASKWNYITLVYNESSGNWDGMLGSTGHALT